MFVSDSGEIFCRERERVCAPTLRKLDQELLLEAGIFAPASLEEAIFFFNALFLSYTRGKTKGSAIQGPLESLRSHEEWGTGRERGGITWHHDLTSHWDMRWSCQRAEQTARRHLLGDPRPTLGRVAWLRLAKPRDPNRRRGFIEHHTYSFEVSVLPVCPSMVLSGKGSCAYEAWVYARLGRSGYRQEMYLCYFKARHSGKRSSLMRHGISRSLPQESVSLMRMWDSLNRYSHVESSTPG